MPKISNVLANINSYNFNIFELDELADMHTLYYVSYEAFVGFDLFAKRKIDQNKFKNFLMTITEGYGRDNPYHNDLHGSDVLQTSYLMINNKDLIKQMDFNDIDVMSLLTAAATHDYKHPGRNNLYQINAKTSVALTYNGEFS